MLALLDRAGIESLDSRVRRTAHAIVASGWRQNVCHYNAWGVQRGGWTGDWYVWGSEEENPDGSMRKTPTQEWRAFTSWRQAIADYDKRINTASSKAGYAAAAAILAAPGRENDAAFWAALGQGGYYTDKKNIHPPDFASICARVRTEFAGATPERLAEAKAWAVEALKAPAKAAGGSESKSPFPGSV
jgi:hypothetical protein